MDEKGNIIVNNIEAEMKRFEQDQNPPTEGGITWEQYQADIQDLPKPSKEQQEAFIETILNNNTLGRIAEDGFKVVIFLTRKEVATTVEKTEEAVKKHGYLSFLVLDNNGMIVHSEGSGFAGKLLPAELTENAAVVEIPQIGEVKLQMDAIATKEGKSLENATEKSF